MTKNCKFFLTILAFFILASCKNKEEQQQEKLEEDLKVYYSINQKDSAAVLDSFKLVMVEKITQKMLMYEQASVLNNQLEYLVDIYKLTNDKMSNSINQMRLYGILDSKSLVDMKRKDFDKESKKSKEIKTELDTVMKIIKLLDSAAVNADTVKSIGFQAKCFYQIRLKDKSIKRDTAYILLNENKDIIKRDDFLKLPYRINFDKYD
jgi:adenylate cyclase class IV